MAAHMAQADITDGPALGTHALQVCQESNSSRYDSVDVGKQRFGFVQRDDLRSW